MVCVDETFINLFKCKVSRMLNSHETRCSKSLAQMSDCTCKHINHVFEISMMQERCCEADDYRVRWTVFHHTYNYTSNFKSRIAQWQKLSLIILWVWMEWVGTQLCTFYICMWKKAAIERSSLPQPSDTATQECAWIPIILIIQVGEKHTYTYIANFMSNNSHNDAAVMSPEWDSERIQTTKIVSVQLQSFHAWKTKSLAMETTHNTNLKSSITFENCISNRKS